MLPARVVMVIGGGAGIGAATARRFGDEGAGIVVVDNLGDRARALADELSSAGVAALALRGDATVEVDVQSVVEQAMARFGRIDALVNCSGGLLTRSRVATMTLGDWQEALASNLTSLFLSCRAVLPAMQAQGSGSIVAVSSEYAWGKAEAAHYSAAKAGMLGFIRSLAREVAEDGIRVNAVAPGIVGTSRVLAELTPTAVAERERTIPMGRFAAPEEAADAIAFLASERAGYITGQVLHVNGGSLMP